jgi:hypothetical protein
MLKTLLEKSANPQALERTPDSQGKSPTIPPLHHQDFWRKARKYSGVSKPTQG